MSRSPAPRLSALLFLLAAPLAWADAAGTIVPIDSGKVAGKLEDGVTSWKGIPYAAPPTGALRWRAPQPPAPWSGLRQATAYGADCMQLPFPSDAAPLGTTPGEDCLYLNVWKPADAKAKLPVLVWIHGGGFVNGGASPPTYSGAPLARQGLLVVSINYRLGRFGFFAHPQLTQENAGKDPLGNYGYMDQLAALRWVQRNAAAFGGDPKQVTIVGESAGGMAVNALLTSPMADGLFARAVVMSGGDGGLPPTSQAAAEQIGAAFASGKGIAADDPAALSKLRLLAPEAVVDGLNLANFNRQDVPTYHGPYADGRLVVDGASAFAGGRVKKVPVMIGATSADIGGKTGFMVAGARLLAGQLADAGLPVYAYRFSYVAKSIGKPGAQHASDIPYFFDTVDVKYGAQTDALDIAMGKAMSGYLANFAKTGNPNGASLPAWPRYARTRDEIVDFADSGKPAAGKDPWGAEIDAARKAAPARR